MWTTVSINVSFLMLMKEFEEPKQQWTMVIKCIKSDIIIFKYKIYKHNKTVAFLLASVFRTYIDNWVKSVLQFCTITIIVTLSHKRDPD